MMTVVRTTPPTTSLFGHAAKTQLATAVLSVLTVASSAFALTPLTPVNSYLVDAAIPSAPGALPTNPQYQVISSSVTATLAALQKNPAIVSTNLNPQTNNLTVINLQVGADRFYNAGYYGFTAAIANVEAGHIWNGHEMLGNVSTYINDPSIDQTGLQYDFHATMVGGILAGLGPPAPGGGYYYYQFGMAPGATLWSTAIASDWVGATGEFNITDKSFKYGYVTTMETGELRPIIPGLPIYTQRPADVINSSWGFDDPTGRATETRVIDGLAYLHHQTVVVAAGNHDTGTAQVTGPASGFNTIAVGALESDTSNPVYGQAASFSNTGPNDFYNPQTGVTITGVRSRVDISAPGTNMILPAYLGTTGTNQNGALVDPTQYPAADLNKLYFMDAAGTSFAAPVVAGGAALLVDAGYQNFNTPPAVDGRVIKAVLLNSADKNSGWNNHTVLTNGVQKTTQALDYATGAGMLNLSRAYDQYLSGTTDLPGLTGGTVQNLGWDFGHVNPGSPNDYLISGSALAGQTMTVTLDWFVNRVYDSAKDKLYDLRFDNLDLQVYLVQNGTLSTLVAESDAFYENVQHLYFTLPQDGQYAIRVLFGGYVYNLSPNSLPGTDYALAWDLAPQQLLNGTFIPEPATALLILPGLSLLLRRRVTVRSV